MQCSDEINVCQNGTGMSVSADPTLHCFILKHSPDVVLDLAVQQTMYVCVSQWAYN